MVQVAVSHYPEGAGHATRMVAVARELEERGASVRLAGGGPGEKFARLNGYEEFVPAVVDYVGDFQDGGSLFDVLRHSVPASFGRVRDYVGWLRRIDPDVLVTDDMFATLAAPIVGVPLFAVTHNASGFYDDAVEHEFARLWNVYQRRVSREFLFPAVWPETVGDPRGVVRIPPIALDGRLATEESEGPQDVGVVVVPSYFSSGTKSLADRIADAGYRVTRVGGEDWEPLPSLVPVLRRAEAVVCSGYSTIMEAAVAGTPCIIYPHTSEQRGVARFITGNAVEGFELATSPESVVSAVSDPPAATPSENGAGEVARRVMDRLANDL